MAAGRGSTSANAVFGRGNKLRRLLLSAAALPATYVPARRASRIDPVESLRME